MIVLRLLLRFLLVPLGMAAAFCVAALVVLIGHWGKLTAAFSSDPPSGGSDSFWVFLFVGGIYMLIWLAVAIYSMLPAVVGVLISEGFAIRHWIFHTANGALSVWIGSTLIDQGDKGFEYLNAPVVVVVGAGIAAGFAYWAVAGWSAGFWKPVFAPPVPPQQLPAPKPEALPRPPAAQA